VPERGGDRLCGLARPGHFRGVLTVVAKLFGIFAPQVAVFGQKDYQQLVLIRRMVADLEMPVTVETGAIVRDEDGLALSSRNRYLSIAERRRATAIHARLRGCASLYASGERSAEVFRRHLHQLADDGVSLEYGEVVDPVTLDPLERVEAGGVCAVAGRVGATRLIDNLVLGTGTPS
jgi:pantoate--beta-alanine ligase